MSATRTRRPPRPAPAPPARVRRREERRERILRDEAAQLARTYAESPWEPGHPLYLNPDDSRDPDSQVTRPLIQLVADTPETLSFDFPRPANRDPASSIRYCSHCLVLWEDSTRCWVCDRYCRPPGSRTPKGRRRPSNATAVLAWLDRVFN